MVRKKLNTKRLYLFVLIVLLLGIFIGLGIDYRANQNVNKNFVNKNINVIRYESTNLDKDSSFAFMKIPAVDNNGNGVVTVLSVEAIPGSGKTLVDIDSLLFFADTQNSIRTAKEVSAQYSGLDLSKYDLVYDLRANASIIGGPSAGVAITIATIAALEKKELKQNVMITGGINHDGTISPVGGILDKAKASKDVGADLFLVPLLQSEEITYEDKEHCRKVGISEFCTIEQIPVRINVQDRAGLTVIEVGNINEAYQYFVN